MTPKLRCLVLTMLIVFSQYSYAQNASNIKTIKVADQNDAPIKGVYAKHNNSFWHSNEVGEITIPSSSVNPKDSIYFSHLGYKKYNVLMIDLLNGNNRVTLEDNLFTLKEVIVSIPDLKQIVKDAIKKIPENYGLAFSSQNYFNTNITLKNNDDSTYLIKYRGGLTFFLDEKNKLLVSKFPEEESVVTNLKDYIFQIKPYNFTTIIGITSHPVIRKFKDFKYTKHEFVVYKGVEAVKIYFEIEKKNGGQSGCIIIDRNNNAIMSLSYTINPIKDWIAAKTKRGVEKTTLISYYVEADYMPNKEGLYLFDSGREKIVLQNSAGKHKANTTSEVYLKRIDKQAEPKDQVELNRIFQ